jgi:hypothetical protein
MPMAMMLVLQAAVPASPPLQPIRFDLRDVRPVDFGLMLPPIPLDCGPTDPNEIIVCGTRHRDHRLRPLPSDFETQPFVAEFHLMGNLTGGTRLEAKELSNGVTSNRIMLNFKLPF